MAIVDPAVLLARWADLEVELVSPAVSTMGSATSTSGASEPAVKVAAGRCLELMQRLRDEPDLSMRRLVDLTVIDRERIGVRFEVVYLLHSPSLNHRLRVHVLLDAHAPRVDSVAEVWPAAGWLEREAFDLFGVEFRGHPDLRRILLEDDFEGAPLRRDYPRQPGLPLPKGEAS